MKKIVTVLLLFYTQTLSASFFHPCLFCETCGQSEPSGYSHFFQLSWFSPIQTGNGNDSIHGLRINLLMGESYDMSGLDIGLVNQTWGNLTGLEIGITNVVYGNARAVMIGANNAVNNTFQGVQIGGVNSVRFHCKGMQLGLVNYAGSLEGIQIGIFNTSYEVNGIQIGLMNVRSCDPCSCNVMPFINVEW